MSSRSAPDVIISRRDASLIRFTRVSRMHRCTDGCPPIRSIPVSAIPTMITLSPELRSLKNLTNWATRARTSCSLITSSSSTMSRPPTLATLSATQAGDSGRTSGVFRSAVSVRVSMPASPIGKRKPAFPPMLVASVRSSISRGTPASKRGDSTICENVVVGSHRTSKIGPSTIEKTDSSSLATLARELFPTPRSPNRRECWPGVPIWRRS